MAYTENKLPTGLDELNSLASSDVVVVGDVSDSGRAKKITKNNLVTDLESVINHDNLQGFVSNEHVNHSSVVITAGDGLSGGGDITTNRTINVDISGTTDLASPAPEDEILVADASNSNAIRKTDLATAINNAGATMNSDTSVAGNGWVVDEDDMSSNDNGKVPTQQSVKAYVDNSLAGAGADGTLASAPASDWFVFHIAPNSTDGITMTNGGTLTTSGGYFTVQDNGGNEAVLSVSIPGAFSTSLGYNNSPEIMVKVLARTSTGHVGGLGFTNFNSVPPYVTSNDCVAVKIDGSSSKFVTSAGATPTETTITLTNDRWTEYVIHYRPGVDARLYVDGSLVATHTTTLPDGFTLFALSTDSGGACFMYSSGITIAIKKP